MNSYYHTLTVTKFPIHLLFPCDKDRALQRHVFSLILDSVLWHELSLAHSDETVASPFDPSREIHLDYLI